MTVLSVVPVHKVVDPASRLLDVSKGFGWIGWRVFRMLPVITP